ncbi:hypothetical protein PR048_015325 [Dryococelus australis]|uniref:Uncharacterized protein n=1 Tax=Dryococelus australis TaxID=614101 RepID=A0ABQ9HGM5_9NEOP|nr:hypothetical protein PR048_015325 [Dryococelus australis]
MNCRRIRIRKLMYIANISKYDILVCPVERRCCCDISKTLFGSRYIAISHARCVRKPLARDTRRVHLATVGRSTRARPRSRMGYSLLTVTCNFSEALMRSYVLRLAQTNTPKGQHTAFVLLQKQLAFKFPPNTSFLATISMLFILNIRSNTMGRMNKVEQWGGMKREIPEKTRRPTASSGTIPTCKNPVTRPGISACSTLFMRPTRLSRVESDEPRADAKTLHSKYYINQSQSTCSCIRGRARKQTRKTAVRSGGRHPRQSEVKIAKEMKEPAVGRDVLARRSSTTGRSTEDTRDASGNKREVCSLVEQVVGGLVGRGLAPGRYAVEMAKIKRDGAVVTDWTRVREDPGSIPCPAILISVIHRFPNYSRQMLVWVPNKGHGQFFPNSLLPAQLAPSLMTSMSTRFNGDGYVLYHAVLTINCYKNNMFLERVTCLEMEQWNTLHESKSLAHRYRAVALPRTACSVDVEVCVCMCESTTIKLRCIDWRPHAARLRHAGQSAATAARCNLWTTHATPLLHEYGAAPEGKGEGNGRSPKKKKKTAYQRHRLAHAKIRGRPFRGSNPVHLSGSSGIRVKFSCHRAVLRTLNTVSSAVLRAILLLYRNYSHVTLSYLADKDTSILPDVTLCFSKDPPSSGSKNICDMFLLLCHVPAQEMKYNNFLYVPTTHVESHSRPTVVLLLALNTYGFIHMALLWLTAGTKTLDIPFMAHDGMLMGMKLMVETMAVHNLYILLVKVSVAIDRPFYGCEVVHRWAIAVVSPRAMLGPFVFTTPGPAIDQQWCRIHASCEPSLTTYLLSTTYPLPKWHSAVLYPYIASPLSTPETACSEVTVENDKCWYVGRTGWHGERQARWWLALLLAGRQTALRHAPHETPAHSPLQRGNETSPNTLSCTAIVKFTFMTSQVNVSCYIHIVVRYVTHAYKSLAIPSFTLMTYEQCDEALGDVIRDFKNAQLTVNCLYPVKRWNKTASLGVATDSRLQRWLHSDDKPKRASCHVFRNVVTLRIYAVQNSTPIRVRQLYLRVMNLYHTNMLSTADTVPFCRYHHDHSGTCTVSTLPAASVADQITSETRYGPPSTALSKTLIGGIKELQIYVHPFPYCSTHTRDELIQLRRVA